MPQRSIQNFFSRKRKPTSSTEISPSKSNGSTSLPSSTVINSSHNLDYSTETRDVSLEESPMSVQKGRRVERFNGESPIRKSSKSQNQRKDVLTEKRAKMIDILGEEDFKAAGNDGIWAEARRNIEWLHPSRVRDGNGFRPGEPGYDKRTVTVPKHVLEGKSKSQRQYWETKSKYMDTVLFFKVGKFYELYELDAEIGHRELDWKLTVSGVGKCLQVGCPESGIDEAVKKLVSRGYKVGRMEQIETGEEAKAKRGPQAMVKRKLLNVVTPSTYTAEDLQAEAVHLLAIKEEFSLPNESSGSGDSCPEFETTVFGFAFVDAAAGKFYVGSIRDDRSRSNFNSLLAQICPQEILYELGGISPETRRVLRLVKGPGLLPVQVTPLQQNTEFLEPQEAQIFLENSRFFFPEGGSQEVNEGISSEDEFRGGPNQKKSTSDFSGYEDESCWTNENVTSVLQQLEESGDQGLAASALTGLICHLKRMKLSNELLPHGTLLPFQLFSGALQLDGQTLKNLELLENSDNGGIHGTLLHYLDSCGTSPGKRLLRSWILKPVLSVPDIVSRQEAVQEIIMKGHLGGQEGFWGEARKLPDLERLGAKIRGMGGNLGGGWGKVGGALGGEKWHQKRLHAFALAVSSFSRALFLLQSLSDCKSCLLRSASCTGSREDLQKILESLEGVLIRPRNKGEKLKMDIKEYFSQKTNSASQDETDSETKISPNKKFDPEAAQDELEKDIFVLSELIFEFNRYTLSWQSVAEAIARVDVLLAFSHSAMSAVGTTCWPQFVQGDKGPVFESKALWHPFAIGQLGSKVVPNDLILGSQESQLEPRAVLLTGANMGGKSTLLRAACLAVIMAQMGCQVAAESLVLSPVDIIFTRLGASDRIIAGESTFLVECNETASVLRNATPNSLVVLDELGRGTSTFDGYSLAFSVLKHLTEKVNCRLLFATHYHPLTVEFSSEPRIALRHMACKVGPLDPTGNFKSKKKARIIDHRNLENSTEENTLLDDNEDDGNDIVTFLYKIKEGAAPKSYGLQVAQLAGVPGKIVQVAAKAAEEFHGKLEKTFERAMYGNKGRLLDLHSNWLKSVLKISRNLVESKGFEDNEEMWEDLLCVWTEIAKSAV